jgi:PAS domain S-box-containing protein
MQSKYNPITENEIKLREIIQQTNDGIVVFNEQKKVVIWNKGAEKIFGVPSKDVLHKSIVDHQKKFVPPELKNNGLLDKMISRIIKFETPEMFYQIRDEEVVGPDFYKNIETVLFPIKLHGYNLFGAIIRDVTEKKNHEKQILQLSADKDRFMQILAHDLRSPFNALLGFSNLLLSNLHKYDKQVIENQITIQKKIIQKTYDLLEDLLLWSRSQMGLLKFDPQEIVLQEIGMELMDVLRESISSKKISIKFFEEKRTIITADANMIKTVLRNLISNAIKFTGTYGAINIYTERNDDLLIIAVSDNGVGISKENQLKLWDLATPYTTGGTENEPGTGLGLIICKELVAKHRGTIWVESEPGKGSTFKFSLPLKLLDVSTLNP